MLNYDREKAESWLREQDRIYPGLTIALRRAKERVLIIGAMTVDLYHRLEWTLPLKRQTGDLDLSVGISLSDSTAYTRIKQRFLELNYVQKEPEKVYRLFPPRSFPVTVNPYLDLLAHPSDGKFPEEDVRSLMGVGSGLSFGAIEFALRECFEIERPICFPNPLAFIALKASSYTDAPDSRARDFADIVELVWGLVERGVHFELGDLWVKVREVEGAEVMQEALRNIAEDTGDEFDLGQIENELFKRGFKDSDLEETIPRRFKDFCQQVFE